MPKAAEKSITGNMLAGVTEPPLGIRNRRIQERTKESAMDSAP